MEYSPRTLRSYDRAFRTFRNWYDGDWRGATPDDLVNYFIAMQDAWVSHSTLGHSRSAIAHHFEAEGLMSPTNHPKVKACLRDAMHVKPKKRKAPGFSYSEMVTIIESLPPNDLLAKRDRAMLLVGWWAKLERGALASLNVYDVRAINGNRWEVRVRADHRQHGTYSHIRDRRLDLIAAKEDWCEAANIEDGPLFRAVGRHRQVSDRAVTGQVVSLVVKHRTHITPSIVSRTVKVHASSALGYDPQQYSARSLTRGPTDLTY